MSGPYNLHTVWMKGELLAIRCTACDHRAVLGQAELPTIRRGNMTPLNSLKLRCGHCGARGQSPDVFMLSIAGPQHSARHLIGGRRRV